MGKYKKSFLFKFIAGGNPFAELQKAIKKNIEDVIEDVATDSIILEPIGTSINIEIRDDETLLFILNSLKSGEDRTKELTFKVNSSKKLLYNGFYRVANFDLTWFFNSPKRILLLPKLPESNESFWSYCATIGRPARF